MLACLYTMYFPIYYRQYKSLVSIPVFRILPVALFYKCLVVPFHVFLLLLVMSDDNAINLDQDHKVRYPSLTPATVGVIYKATTC